ncbi:MAG: YkgJ family cysteine cluster protein [Thermomicrobiales bacterium]
MSTNASYIRMRQEVLNFDQEAAPYCFCKAIDGGCCKRDLTLLPEDEGVILEAVAGGEIEPSTIARARPRARDDNEEFCPFLGDRGECTIYAHRPLVCMQHGNGGLPRDRALAKRAIQKPGNKTIKVSDLEMFACNACAEQVNQNDRIPLSVAGKSTAILITIQDRQHQGGCRTMNEFVDAEFDAFE